MTTADVAMCAAERATVPGVSECRHAIFPDVHVCVRGSFHGGKHECSCGKEWAVHHD